MAEKTLSIFGHLMNTLHISTVSLAHSIHVDPSLVSKWKSGTRSLKEKSIYFEDIIAYFLENTPDSDLKKSLSSLYPGEALQTPEQIESALRQVLSGNESYPISPILLSGADNVVSSLTFSGNDGKRNALAKLLDYADQMSVAGQLTFMDAGNFVWLTEDSSFSDEFIERIIHLSEKGFVCRFMIHIDISREEFVRFFSVVNRLIFHRNIEWYYLPYFNSPMFNITISVLNQAVSLISLSSQNQYTSTTLITNNSLVITHEAMIRHVLEQCSPVSHNLELIEFSNILKSIQLYHRRSGIFYCVLSSPTFIMVNQNLLLEILKDNQIDQSTIERCLEINQSLHSLSEFEKNPFICIFRYNRLMDRAVKAPFISQSLSLICKKEVIIAPVFYAKQLRLLANALRKYGNLRIILATDKDKPAVPSIDCWSKQNTWLLQMDAKGFRYYEDPSIINAASQFMAYCIKDIPSRRKEPESVRHYLLDLARELEKM